MKESVFHCKEFSVRQQKAALKVGTDSILLGAFTEFSEPTHILDIGTGTGILSLLMAQKYNCSIIGIDIDAGAIEDAEYNFNTSTWHSNLQALHISLEEFSQKNENKFDGIICNPPFFSNSLQSTDTAKNIARHTIHINPQSLLHAANTLLTENGILYCIFPYSEKLPYLQAAQESNLYIHTEVEISATTDSKPNRLIMAFGKQWKSTTKKTIHIRNTQRNYTQEYRELTKDIYVSLS